MKNSKKHPFVHHRFSGILLSLTLLLFTIATNAKDTDDYNLTAAMQPVAQENIFHDDEYFNWGSTIVKGKDGKYHLFYDQMPKKHGFYSWLTDGIVSRAVSDSPTGPWTKVQEVMGGRGDGYWDQYTVHCTKVYEFDGKYYLYYMSTNSGITDLTKEQLQEARSSDWEPGNLRNMLRLNQRIGVAVADNIEGPWKRFDRPVFEPQLPIANQSNNVTVTKRPEGDYLMVIRGDQPDQKPNEIIRMQAALLADNPLGPWKMQPKPVVINYNSEDPEVWYDAQRKRYYNLYHAFGYMGMLTSTDGLNWERAKHYKVADKEYVTTTGKTVEVHRYERMGIYSENGKPLVMTAGIFLKNGDTHSLFIPLKQ
ncbi:glycoside hydrolase family protein [Paraglaciecola aquimarina]|uniref:Glycoside hydrolase family protein n=1 Tax=Paraglaciecola algarum TaxID=3050085 RepID=A0ABS9DBL6_9ALTE|nr:glycoside hydrolase family protein [Paraglaciecola sp. G1-23]MCF2950119.1 glycoside hydrolase family protein [Paraglaciecola sp. G1-23]